MEKYDYLVVLYDYYQNLLTDLQRKIFEYYYFDNYSLMEISELCDVSRNAIHKNLKNIEKKLCDYEDKLKLYDKREKIVKIIDSNSFDKIKDLI